MKKEVLLSAIMSIVTLTVTADEYIDPQTNVIYTYEPGQTSASVKAGYHEVIDMGSGELDVIYHPGSPDAAGNVVILDRFTVGTDEYVVTSIGEDAFRENGNIKSISIPETVIDIGASAFASCNSLASAQLPNGLTHIGPDMFRGSIQLVSVIIPSSVTTIDYWAFGGCTSLTDLTLPESLAFVGRYAFYGTPWYAAQYNEAPDGPFYIGQILFGYKGEKPTGELVIKEGTTCVGFEAFKGCDGLTSITIPSSVDYIDSGAFEGCDGLQAVHITDLAAWCDIEFQSELRSSSNPLSKAHHLYLNSEEVTNLVIPEGIASIGDYAFDYCTALTSVSIPEGITTIGTYAFRGCEDLTSVTIPSSLSTIGGNAFIWCFNLDTVHISDLAAWCGISFFWGANPLYYGANIYLGGEKVTDLVIPEGVASIGDGAFRGCSSLISVTIPSSINNIGEYAFEQCKGLTNVISHIEEPYEILDNVFEMYNDEPYERYFTSATLYVPNGCKARYESTAGWKRFSKIIEDDYRPFVEEGKVWKVGTVPTDLDSPVQIVDYYYFDGDTIIDGKTCKMMMCQHFTSPNYPYYEYLSQPNSLRYVGAWYEENQKVYFYDERTQSMVMKYDFSLGANETVSLLGDYLPFIIGPKQTGGLDGFKGVYRDVMICVNEDQIANNTIWLEGVGGIDGPTKNAYYIDTLADRVPEFLMACVVGDEVIFLNDKYEDEATPAGARKNRFDFTHTNKLKPKTRVRSEEEPSLYGEYNDQQLDINLGLLDDAYQVSITDGSGKAVYEKVINAGNIVALNIDISDYAKDHYTVTVENSRESFSGEFETLTNGISDAVRLNDKGKIINDKRIYNLQGQRLSRLQKGLNIVNGKKIYVRN